MSKTPETFEIAAQKVLAQHNLMNPYQLTLNQRQVMDGLLAAHTAALEAAKREARIAFADELYDKRGPVLHPDSGHMFDAVDIADIEAQLSHPNQPKQEGGGE